MLSRVDHYFSTVEKLEIGAILELLYFTIWTKVKWSKLSFLINALYWDQILQKVKTKLCRSKPGFVINPPLRLGPVKEREWACALCSCDFTLDMKYLRCCLLTLYQALHWVCRALQQCIILWSSLWCHLSLTLHFMIKRSCWYDCVFLVVFENCIPTSSQPVSSPWQQACKRQAILRTVAPVVLVLPFLSLSLL